MERTISSEMILSVENLMIRLPTLKKDNLLVENLSLEISRKQIVGLVGESGCGKTITALAITRLLPLPLQLTAKRLFLEDIDLLALDEKKFQEIRGRLISMIFQDPMTCLNPLLRIGNQIEGVLNKHKVMSGNLASERAMELLSAVGIPDTKKRYGSYPHELSGGMRQRVLIAMAISCLPKLIIADEPTTALDVTIQSQILDLLLMLSEKYDMSMLLITHDFGVAAEVCKEIAVMYAGRIVEKTITKELFSSAFHPYTQGLLECAGKKRDKDNHLAAIFGSVPARGLILRGCKFQNRCRHVFTRCFEEDPPLIDVGGGHLVACWLT